MVFNLGREPTEEEISQTAKSMKVKHRFATSYCQVEGKLHKTLACNDKECDCSDHSCSNVSRSQECPPKCKKSCKNQFSRTRMDPIPFVIADAGEKGKGLFAKTHISKGTRLLYYAGEIISKAESLERLEKYEAEGVEHNYLYECGQFVCDPTKYGNAGKYANNSCYPNLETEQWKIHGTHKGYRAIFFTAVRDIPKGDELTIKYDFECDPSIERKCFCGEEICTGSLNKLPSEPNKRSKQSSGGASEKKKAKKS
ncbi:hypothetical protein B9Z55_024857 [Caenorhabditis nigoni]|uniref:SET domain-containing protein n=2 Tax=Caenorhabditis nigoni TaxID=1611254 RepID=A0A2G5SWN5_9PELO|nr:hypothetical protein B9Z55_024857 [Caenorhabditis nigoni]